jgi:hypothetical protein
VWAAGTTCRGNNCAGRSAVIFWVGRILLLPETRPMARKTDTIHRVFPLPDDLRVALRATRERRGETNARLVTEAVATHLPVLVERLQSLGFGRPKSRVRPARLPFSEATLKALRVASQEVAIPACALLALCLSAATADGAKPNRRRRLRH